MSNWTTQVIADAGCNWVGNGLTFATKDEATDYVIHLSWRWTAVRQWRAIETDKPVTHVYFNGRLTDVPLQTTVPVHLKKGDKLVYRSGHDCLFSATVQRAHKDRTWTVQLNFALDADGKEAGCFQGDKHRVGSANIVSAWATWRRA